LNSLRDVSIVESVILFGKKIVNLELINKSVSVSDLKGNIFDIEVNFTIGSN